MNTLRIEYIKRFCAILGLVLFVFGFLLIPSLHELDDDHCGSSEHSESHCPETCAICKVAATVIDIPCAHIAIVDVPQQITSLCLPDVRFSNYFTPQNHLARAPPVA